MSETSLKRANLALQGHLGLLHPRLINLIVAFHTQQVVGVGLLAGFDVGAIFEGFRAPITVSKISHNRAVIRLLN